MIIDIDCSQGPLTRFEGFKRQPPDHTLEDRLSLETALERSEDPGWARFPHVRVHFRE